VAENPVAGATVDWRGLDLGRVAGTNRWTGSLVLTGGTTSVEFIVQAKDLAGNVGFASNKARNFGQLVLPPPPPPPPPPPAQLTVVAPTPPASGWFDGTATITIAQSASLATVTVNGVVRPGTFSAGQSFEIISDGVSTWTVTTANGQSTSGTVRVDADGAPDVTPGTPRADGGGVYVTGTRSVDVICRDTSLVACDLTIDGPGQTSVPIENGVPLPAAPGTYTLTYRSTDQVGNVSGGTASFEIVAVAAAPVLGEVTVTPTDPLSIGVPVDIATPFTDASAPYDTLTATIDWGDGSPEETIALVTPGSPNEGGTITGNHVFDAVGSYTVAITLTDSTDRAATTSVDVLVVDLDAGPVIRNFSLPTNEQPIGATVDLSAVFSDDSVPADFFTGSIDWGDGTIEDAVLIQPTASTNGQAAGSHEYNVAGVFEIVLTITDSTERSVEVGATVSVVAPAGDPIIRTIAGPSTPQEITDAVAVSATFGDASGPFDTYTATIDWGDGTSSIAAVVPPTASDDGTITGDHIYAETGVYPITITVTDAAGASDSELFEFAVVFDPTIRGRVNGSGFYWSGREARPGGSRWGAPAFFGYDARYKKNSDLPVGDTQLRLLGDFFFRSTSYDYLIVNDAIAIAEGVGTMGGGTSYRFRVQGVDNGWLDFFQITIWDPTTGTVLYDNGVLYDKGDIVLLGGIKVKDK
jgi:hypothetical protein